MGNLNVRRQLNCTTSVLVIHFTSTNLVVHFIRLNYQQISAVFYFYFFNMNICTVFCQAIYMKYEIRCTCLWLFQKIGDVTFHLKLSQTLR